MANYTAADIKEIRELTGAGMLDVKKALDEAKGDKASAIEVLRVAGAKAAAKRGERVTAEGLVAAKVISSKAGQTGYLIELNSETDFVAKSDDFIALAEEVLNAIVEADASNVEEGLKAKTAKHDSVAEAIEDIAGTKLRENIVLKSVGKVEGEVVGQYLHKKDPALPPYVGVLVALNGGDEAIAARVATHLSGPLAINGSFPYKDITDVPKDVLESEERVARAKNAGKPDNIMPKIVEGFMRAFYKQNVLSEQHFGLDDGHPTIKSILNGAAIEDYIGFLVGGE